MGEANDTYMTTVQAASFLAMSERTLENWRCTGYGPPFAQFGRRVTYLKSDLEGWAGAQRFTSTSEARAAREAA